jgi:fructoselysine 6-phosphate deglycase
MNDATSLLHADVERALNGLTDKKIDHVFFVACGGSLSVMYPGKFLLDSYSRKLASDCLNADEFVQRDPVILGSTSLVILCSMTGTTTVGLSVDTLSPLAQEVDFPIGFEAPYTTGVPIDARDSNYARLYQLVMGLVKAHDGIDKLAPLVASLNNLQPAIDRAHATFEPLFTQYAGQLHGESVIYTLASGASYGAAYSWINSQAVHAGEFFHGPFEVLDRDRAFVLLMGLDRTRPQQERAKVFLERFGSPEKIMVLDAAKLDLDGIDDEFKGNLVPLIFFDTLWKFAYKMANLRNHVMLEGRRYMKKISY